MPIEIPCPGCGQQLRVGDEHAGKMARCPQCGTITRIPAPGETSEPAAEAAGPFAPREAPEAKPLPQEQQPENPFGENPYSPPSPFQPSSPAAAPPRYQRPHRGGVILTLGILGVLCCLICGIIAWAMGASDLKAMQRGEMDPSGRALTQAGMILGIISVAFAGIWLLINVLGMMAGGF